MAQTSKDLHQAVSLLKESHRTKTFFFLHSVQFSRSVICDSLRPHGLQQPGFPVYHQLLEPAQIHVHRVGYSIQPSHPLSSPSPPAFNLSHLQGLFYWVSSLHEVAKVLEHQHQSFQWVIQNWFPLGLMVGSPCSPRDSQESFSTPQFKSINSLVFSFIYGPTPSIHDY